jgi:putative tryptophan/tyrosine transport system substrate-binding protein
VRKFLLALAVTGFVTPAVAADVTVAVTSIVEHPALNAVRDGVKEALAAAGFKDGANGFHLVFETAQGKPEIAAQIAKKFVGDNVSVIVAISTPSAQGAVAATKDIPIVFSAVTDPIAAQIVGSLKKPGANVTGVSDKSPVPAHVALIKDITPNVKKLGVIFNPGETNSVVLVAWLKEIAGPAGLTVVESPATKSGEVKQAALALVGRVDAIYIPTDNTVVSALEAAVSVAEENKIPLYAGDTDSVARGAIASVGFNYHDVGIDTGKIVARVLKGEKPGDIDVSFSTGTDLVVNKGAAAKVGVTIPDAVLKRALKVIE